MRRRNRSWFVMIAMSLILLVFYLCIQVASRGEPVISRALTARMLSYLIPENTEDQPQVFVADLEEGLWYTPYVHQVLDNQQMAGDGDFFFPMNALTYQEAFSILERYQIPSDSLEFSLHYWNKTKDIPLKRWLQIYEVLVKKTGGAAYKTQLLIKAPNPSPWTVETSLGTLGCEGVQVSGLEGCLVEGWVIKDQLLCVSEILSSADILQSQENVRQGETLQEEEAGQGDEIKSEASKDIVREAESTAAESMTLPVETTTLPEAPLEDQVKSDQIALITKGTMDIRVLLSTSDYQSHFHEYLTVTGDNGLSIYTQEGVHTYEPGAVVTLGTGDVGTLENPLMIEGDGGRLTVLSINRQQGNPSYGGILKVFNGSEGMMVVNQVDLEDYLCGVVPSEMPASYAQEALCAQAICARTFGVNAIENPKYEAYGADLDDSVSSQVYENQPRSEASTQAVLETKGQILALDGQAIETFFFSTSCGHTAGAGEVWQSDNRYLKGRVIGGDSVQAVLASQQAENLSVEENFRRFIDLGTELDTFEKSEDWYRWQVQLSLAEIGDALYKNLGIGLGAIESVTVTERGESGVARSLYIQGSDHGETIQGEYAIRKALAPLYGTLALNNGSTLEGYSMLPSGFFYLEPMGDGYMVYGGGFGHGVGLSQNGANAMAKLGFDYTEILEYFYNVGSSQ